MLTIAEKDSTLSFASGSAVFLLPINGKDTYSLGYSRCDRLVALHFS